MDALKLITIHSDKGVFHPKPLDPLYLTTCNSHQIRFLNDVNHRVVKPRNSQHPQSLNVCVDFERRKKRTCLLDLKQ